MRLRKMILHHKTVVLRFHLTLQCESRALVQFRSCVEMSGVLLPAHHGLEDEARVLQR